MRVQCAGSAEALAIPVLPSHTDCFQSLSTKWHRHCFCSSKGVSMQPLGGKSLLANK